MEKKKNLPTLNEVLKRVAILCEAHSDAALARALSVSRQTVSTWRKRGTIPYEAITQFAHEKNVSLDYLLLGYENDDKALIPIDERLFKEVVSILAAEESELRLMGKRVDFAQYAAMIYNSVYRMESPEVRKETAAKMVDTMSIHLIKEVLNNTLYNSTWDPEHHAKSTVARYKKLQERLVELESK